VQIQLAKDCWVTKKPSPIAGEFGKGRTVRQQRLARAVADDLAKGGVRRVTDRPANPPWSNGQNALVRPATGEGRHSFHSRKLPISLLVRELHRITLLPSVGHPDCATTHKAATQVRTSGHGARLFDRCHTLPVKRLLANCSTIFVGPPKEFLIAFDH
jgi:hypothetical protein